MLGSRIHCLSRALTDWWSFHMGIIEGWFDRTPETPEDRAIREEGERELDRCPGVGRLIVHRPKWDGDNPDSQQHKADHKRYATFRWSGGQVRQHHAIFVIRLAQCRPLITSFYT